jgi:undecaprenyl-diphosphatase
MRSPNRELTLGQALTLGALQGPTELLPISSSAHTTTAAWLMGWPWEDLDPELRKSFEVALHAGTALALLCDGRAFFRLGSQSALLTIAACLPPALAGYVLERQIESRLGTPATIAAALIAGSATMILADRAPKRRAWHDATPLDGLWLGVAQASALVPGVSRAGATLSAARLRGFRSSDARRLSEQVGLPVLAGAALLKAIRLRSRDLEPGWLPVFAAGIAGAFASTFACAERVPRRGSSGQLLPYAVYRVGLAALILTRRLGSAAHDQGQARPT